LHREANQFVISVKREYPEFFSGKKVLEVGSLDINGSVRQYFADCTYHGIDLGEGPGVDAVKHVTQVRGDGLWDVVISTEALEHDSRWDESLKQMHALLKPGGLLLITCAGPTRAEHGTIRTDGGWASPSTSDYYRNISTEDFASALPATLFSKSYLGYRNDHADLYFAGIKQAGTVQSAIESKYREYVSENLAAMNEIASNATEFTERGVRFQYEPAKRVTKSRTVTVEISTLNRYFTTLPMAIASVATQTRKPDKLVLYDDGEQNELRGVSPYTELFHLLQDAGIPFETFKTPRLGLAANHQHALENCTTDFLLRVDDDHILEPDIIEKLLKVMEDETVGAVAPLVLQPGHIAPLPKGVEGKVEDIFNGTNLQWFVDGDRLRDVEHLYSCYLFRVKAGREVGGYPKLTNVSFREDSWFSMKLKRAGYKLIVDPTITVWHLQQSTGGVRTFNDGSLWAQDDAKFREWLASCGVEDNSPKLVVLDAGIGDHFAALSILPQLKEIHKERGLVLAVSHEGIFDDQDIPIISIAEAQQRLGARFSDSNLYAWMARNNWKRPMTEAMLAFWK